MEIKFHVEYSTLISFSSRCPIKIQLCAGVSDGVWFGGFVVFFIHFAVCRNLGHYRVFHCHLCGYFHSASTRYCLVVGWVGFCSDFDRMKFQFKFEFPFCVWNFTEWKALRREQKKQRQRYLQWEWVFMPSSKRSAARQMMSGGFELSSFCRKNDRHTAIGEVISTNQLKGGKSMAKWRERERAKKYPNT